MQGEQTAILAVHGMSCGGCAAGVERKLRAVAGIQSAHVSLDQAQARVTFDPTSTTAQQLAEVIREAGYDVQVLNEAR